MRVLILGGSKSGKSHIAQELVKELASGGKMYYWATMEPTDSEDEERIEKHLIDRAGWGFETIECGRDIKSVHPIEGSSVLFDSVTALLANEMFCTAEPDAGASRRVLDDILYVSERADHFVCVCDEVFREGVEYGGWTDEYIRGLAGICRGLAEEFDAVVEVCAGRLKYHKGVLPGFEV